MVHEAVVSGLCGNSVRDGKVILVSATELVASEVTTPDTPGEPVIEGMTELDCAPEWVARVAVVAGALEERVRGRITILAFVPELVVCEVTIPGTSGKMCVFGTAKLASVPILVAIDSMLSESVWEALEFVLGTVGLDS